jgi:phage recombination protein Bet
MQSEPRAMALADKNATRQSPPMRMALPAVVADEFGIDSVYWKALTEVVFPSVETVDAIVMALAYCRARNLDVMKKVVHVVPVWNAKLGKNVEGVWPGISELRTTAMRTNSYAGKKKTALGPIIKKKVGTIEMEFPEWAQVTVRRRMGKQVFEFEGPEVYWLEAYSSKGKDPTPNAMWSKRPIGQLDKCAEAAALRVAFPEELGGEIAAEEVQYMQNATANVSLTKTVKLTHGPDDKIEEVREVDSVIDNETGEILDAVVEETPNAPEVGIELPKHPIHTESRKEEKKGFSVDWFTSSIQQAKSWNGIEVFVNKVKSIYQGDWFGALAESESSAAIYSALKGSEWFKDAPESSLLRSEIIRGNNYETQVTHD